MGLIKRDTIEINAAKVESVDVRQSILGRFLDYGTVIVSGTGWKALPMVSVAKPLELRRAVGRISSNARPASRQPWMLPLSAPSEYRCAESGSILSREAGNRDDSGITGAARMRYARCGPRPPRPGRPPAPASRPR